MVSDNEEVIHDLSVVAELKLYMDARHPGNRIVIHDLSVVAELKRYRR